MVACTSYHLIELVFVNGFRRQLRVNVVSTIVQVFEVLLYFDVKNSALFIKHATFVDFNVHFQMHCNLRSV